MAVRVFDIRYGPDDADSPVVGILATITSAGRDGRMAAIGVYKSALTRFGVVQRRQPFNGVNHPHS
ncbi:hypothetical protein [Micromonospora sp. LOL_023]|uniref:hypothetical protein n=1 Tax=Micromonospora sp. LOL_023 TaxID=3345418 RepID=UPI003A83BC9C